MDLQTGYYTTSALELRWRSYIKVVRMYECTVCKAKFPNKLQFAQHNKTHKPFLCPYCTYRSSLKAIMKNHINLQHIMSNRCTPAIMKQKYEVIVVEYQCKMCKQQFPSKRKFHEHHLSNPNCKLKFCMCCDNVKSGEAIGVGNASNEDGTDENMSDDEFDGIDMEASKLLNHTWINKGCKPFESYRSSLKSTLKGHIQRQYDSGYQIASEVIPTNEMIGNATLKKDENIFIKTEAVDYENPYQLYVEEKVADYNITGQDDIKCDITEEISQYIIFLPKSDDSIRKRNHITETEDTESRDSEQVVKQETIDYFEDEHKYDVIHENLWVSEEVGIKFEGENLDYCEKEGNDYSKTEESCVKVENEIVGNQIKSEQHNFEFVCE